MSLYIHRRAKNGWLGRWCRNITSLSPRIKMRGGSDVINKVTDSFQQHIRRTEVSGVRRVFTSGWSGILFDCTQGVSPWQSILFRTRQRLKTMKAVLLLTVTELTSRAHASADPHGHGFFPLMLTSLILRHPSPLCFTLTSLLLSFCFPPLRAAWEKQVSYDWVLHVGLIDILSTQSYPIIA